MKLPVAIVLAWLVVGCGKKSSATDLALSMSASPPGVSGRPGFTIEIPNDARSEVIVVRIDEKTVPMRETLDLATRPAGVSVRLVIGKSSRPLSAVSGRIAWAASVGDLYSVWMNDVRFVDADGRTIIVPQRGAYYVPVGPRKS